MQRELAEKEIAELREREEQVKQAQREAKEQADDEKLCVVCLSEPKSIMLEPCRHVCLCPACEPSIDKCPMCREVPSRRVPLYIS